MKNAIPYLTFNGNCREAMYFYKECIGGELNFQTVGESTMAAQMPKKMKDCILHSTLTNGNIILMATDLTPESGRIKGNNISLLLDCSGEEETKLCFAKLSADGKVNHPLENTFWGALFGELTDKYGNQWLLSCKKIK